MAKVPKEALSRERPNRWKVGLRIGLLGAGAVLFVRLQGDWPFQKRNLATQQILSVTAIALLVWWTFLSRAPQRLRVGVTYGLGVAALLGALLFRLGGLTGDMAPILEFRWGRTETPRLPPVKADSSPGSVVQLINRSDHAAFPQFYGPNRDGVLPGPRLATDWLANPPRVSWRRAIGLGWSGFAMVGDVCIGQEQRGGEECVVARSLLTGEPLWVHADPVRYGTVIGGEGPRATPTLTGARVLAYGATGLLNCLDLLTGNCLWSRDVVRESGGNAPEWGATSSPLIVNDLVIVHAGEGGDHSLIAFHIADGSPAWQGGERPSYASPISANLAGVPQVLSFNDGSISGHNPKTGVTLWQRPWGNGNVVCSLPLIVSTNRVLFSSGYGVGSELLEIGRQANDTLTVRSLWKSPRLKSKFAHLYSRDGCVFGLDDGIFACLSLDDGRLQWKEGRYGHGQGLLVGDLYLLMAESGELVLLRPTPAAPDELGRFRVFDSKTWNPIALSGERLLVRNDREVACLELKLAP